MVVCLGFYADIEVWNVLGERDVGERRVGEKLGRAFACRIVYRFQDFERVLGVAANRAKGGRGFKAVHAAGVGNGDALHVLDDVAGALEFKVLGLAAERLARDRSRVRHGNRLRASQRADELPVQDAAVLLVTVGNGGGIDLVGHVCSSTTGLWRPHCSARARLCATRAVRSAIMRGRASHPARYRRALAPGARRIALQSR